MKSSLVVLLTCAVLFLAVVAVYGFDADSAPQDEILAYQVSPERDVEVTLHGGVERVTLTSWLLVPLDTPRDAPLPYALDVRLSDSAGASQSSRRFETLTRLPPEDAEASAQARVADALALASEPRTIDVDVRSLAGKAGRLRVRSVAGRFSQVLLRLAHEVERTDFEKALLARTLSPDKRRQLLSERSSLGFFDMPTSVRFEALGHWQRRLTAAGREGRDYSVRRLLIGGRSAPDDGTVLSGLSFESSIVRRLALNLATPLRLRVRSREDTEVVVQQTGDEELSRHFIAAGRSAELEVGRDGLGTIVLYADPPSELSLRAPAEDEAALVTRQPPAQHGRELSLSPDFVRTRVYRLSPERPLVSGVAPGQRQLGLGVRSTQPLALESTRSASVVVVWRDDGQTEVGRVPLTFSLEASVFETVDGGPASERRVAHLHVPDGATVAELFGPSHLVASLFVPEPDEQEQILEEPYDRPPPEDHRWCNAPSERKPWANLRPDNVAELRDSGREVTLVAQVRLEPLSSTSHRLAARTLEPRGEPTRRALFSPVRVEPGLPFPSNGWTLLSRDRPSVRAVVPDSGQIELRYYTDPRQLGRRWSLTRDGEPLAEIDLILNSGRRRVVAPPGEATLALGGLGESGIALMRLQPRGSAPVLKRQTVYALDAGRRLDFDFERRERELVSVVLVVVVRGSREAVTLEHRVDGGRITSRADHFYRRTTEFSGLHRLAAGDFTPALAWAEPFALGAGELPDHLARVVVTLGDDLSVGRHRLSVINPSSAVGSGGNRYWIRAVLVGSELPNP